MVSSKSEGQIVLIPPEQKRILIITNQASAMTHVGDYVEVSGEIDEQAKSIHTESLKLLT